MREFLDAGIWAERRATRRFSKFPAPRSCDDVTGPTPRVPRSVDHRRPERTKREYGESGGKFLSRIKLNFFFRPLFLLTFSRKILCFLSISNDWSLRMCYLVSELLQLTYI